MLILPAIDLLGGKCVRLLKGDYNAVTVYSDSPRGQSEKFREEGATFLHVVDLDGARQGKPVNIESVQEIVSVGLPIELGGGIRSLRDVETVLGLGVRRAILGTALVRNAELRQAAFKEFGDRVVAGIDAKNGKVAVEGWEEESIIDAVEFAKRIVGEGCQTVIATDIATDGTLKGPNLGFLKRFTEIQDLKVIASGGVGTIDDLAAIHALQPPVEGAIVGKAIYENRFTVREAVSIYQK